MMKIFDWILRICALLSAALLTAITLAITVNIILRNIGLPTLYGTLDLVEYALLFATFLAAPWVLSQHAHIQVDLVINTLPSQLQTKLRQLTCIIGALFCLFFTWFGFLAVQNSIEKMSMVRAAFVIPEWWLLSVAPFSLLLCAIEFLRQFIFPSSKKLDTL